MELRRAQDAANASLQSIGDQRIERDHLKNAWHYILYHSGTPAQPPPLFTCPWLPARATRPKKQRSSIRHSRLGLTF